MGSPIKTFGNFLEARQGDKGQDMKIERKDGIVVTTMTFSECFFGYDDHNLSKEIINRLNEVISYPYQPDRLNPEGVSNNVCDSRDPEYKENQGVTQK